MISMGNGDGDSIEGLASIQGRCKATDAPRCGQVEPFMSNFPVYQSKSMGPVVCDGNLEVSGNKAGACSRWCMADETERRETKQVGASHENGLEQVGARAGCWSRN
jgi:hypothetical protein